MRRSDVNQRANAYLNKHRRPHYLDGHITDAYKAAVSAAGFTYYELSDQPRIAQLQQLTHLTFDGDLIGKSMRDELVKDGLAQRVNGGWNIITSEGIKYLESGGFIHP